MKHDDTERFEAFIARMRASAREPVAHPYHAGDRQCQRETGAGGLRQLTSHRLVQKQGDCHSC
jgi:hypothetical protein